MEGIMKIVDNVEFSHIKEAVISHKVVYIRDEQDGGYVRDDSRTKASVIEKNVMPDYMSDNKMANYVREYVGIKKWKIVYSSGTINIFKKKKKVKHEIMHKDIKEEIKGKKVKKNKVG